jgi:hypothetical protein
MVAPSMAMITTSVRIVMVVEVVVVVGVVVGIDADLLQLDVEVKEENPTVMPVLVVLATGMAAWITVSKMEVAIMPMRGKRPVCNHAKKPK